MVLCFVRGTVEFAPYPLTSCEGVALSETVSRSWGKVRARIKLGFHQGFPFVAQAGYDTKGMVAPVGVPPQWENAGVPTFSRLPAGM